MPHRRRRRRPGPHLLVVKMALGDHGRNCGLWIIDLKILRNRETLDFERFMSCRSNCVSFPVFSRCFLSFLFLLLTLLLFLTHAAYGEAYMPLMSLS